MPAYDLELKAVLENVESISADENTIWRVKMECSNCQEVSPSFIEVSSKEEVDVPGTRGTCNCLYTCKGSVFVRDSNRLDARGRFRSTWRQNRSHRAHHQRSGPSSFRSRCVEESLQSSSLLSVQSRSLMTRTDSLSYRRAELCLKTWTFRTTLRSTMVVLVCWLDA